MRSYKLSKQAILDLSAIADYGHENYGLEKSAEYCKALENQFQRLTEQPFLYSSVDHIRENYRRCVHGVNIIYYQVNKENIIIIRVLGKQDLRTAFDA